MSSSEDRPTIRTEEEVMFFDTDCAAVVHNLAYLRFIETARTKLANQIGLDLRQMSESQLYPVLVRTEIDYHRPARLGEELVIDGDIDLFEGVRFWCNFRVSRPADDTLLVTCRQSLALVQMPAGRPQRLPAEWTERYPHLAKK